MLQLIQTFQSENWNVSYASTANTSSNAINLSNLGIDIATIQLNDSNFDEFLVAVNPDIVVFDRFLIEEQFGWRVAEALPNAMRILDTEDLHCLRKTREFAIKNKVPFKEEDILKTDIAKREIASILRCDLSLIISNYEVKLLTDLFKIDKNILHYLPFLLNKITPNEIEELPDFEERQHFYFIGNFLHQPNYDAVLYLKKEIWPIISKQLPKAELHVFGAYPSQKITQLNNTKERFIIKGKLNDLNELKKYKICLAPLRFGAGIKGKLVEAMQFGTPSITTNIGAESMHGNLEWNGVIKNNPIDFSNAAVKVYLNAFLWKTALQNGFKIINTIYDKTFFEKELIQQITSIQQNLSQHRLQNFLGELLHHHTLKSTKYLSKWIEEKNKN